MDLADLRRSYENQGLVMADTAADPVEQFTIWFKQAQAAELAEPNAMVVATVDAEGLPSARVVLLKGFDASGFVFFTNYNSAKGHDLAVSGTTSLLFSWLDLHRQVRIVGPVSETSAEESDEYFARRPRGSQLGAWASPQSEVIANRATLDAAWAEAEQRFGAEPIPRPPHWGGYRVAPDTVEFWQGRPNRMHDRIRYQRASDTDGRWSRQRLAP